MPTGALYACLAYMLWGLFPIYFKQLAAVSPMDVLAHRIVWALLFLLVVLAVRRQWAWLAPTLRQPRVIAAFTASALLLSLNWLTYIWAVVHDRVVDASLGYFITPLFSVLLGYAVLRERLRPVQWTAIALAAAGVLWLALQGRQLPWVALVLAVTFGGYGLMRKTAALGALEGLTLETLLLALPAAVLLGVEALHGSGSFPNASPRLNTLLVALGPVTAIPLLLFAAGARRLRLATLGVLQYLAPTLQFACGVWLYHEPFSGPRVIGFVFIWAALVVYSAEGWRAGRAVASATLQPKRRA